MPPPTEFLETLLPYEEAALPSPFCEEAALPLTSTYLAPSGIIKTSAYLAATRSGGRVRTLPHDIAAPKEGSSATLL